MYADGGLLHMAANGKYLALMGTIAVAMIMGLGFLATSLVPLIETQPQMEALTPAVVPTPVPAPAPQPGVMRAGPEEEAAIPPLQAGGAFPQPDFWLLLEDEAATLRIMPGETATVHFRVQPQGGPMMTISLAASTVADVGLSASVSPARVPLQSFEAVSGEMHLRAAPDAVEGEYPVTLRAEATQPPYGLIRSLTVTVAVVHP
ncbi:MAG: hypothetical protein ACE5PO_05310 [Candidatus Bathyarchaeia archaeon]